MMSFVEGHIKKPSRSGVISTIVISFAKYASCCGLIFVDRRLTTKFTKIYAAQKFLCVQ